MMNETPNKISQPKTGTDFLASSHFTISNDSRWGPKHDSEAYKSIFKKDYIPLPLKKRERIPSPDPAGMMHQDSRYGDNNSITKSHFREKKLSRQNPRDSYELRRTNFKGDSDEKLKSFATTHKEYFPVRPLCEAKSTPSTGRTEWMKSCIPQGDREKELLPQSDYKSRYLGKQGPNCPLFVKGDQSGRLTITGDPRTQDGQFTTTTKTEFINRYLPMQRLDPSLFASGSNLPQGDPEKCIFHKSTQQESFRSKPISSDFEYYNQNEAVRKLRATTFQLGDHRSPGLLKTTTLDSYPLKTMDARVTPANVSMSKSNFPEGDTNPRRSLDRVSKTTNDIFFGSPVSGFKNPKVDGSKVRTKSNVHLGHAPSERYYDTSMKTDYTATLDINTIQPSGSLYKSSLPLDYYRGHVGVSTTWSDFPQHDGFKKLVPDPTAVQNLKMSHSPSDAWCNGIWNNASTDIHTKENITLHS